MINNNELVVNKKSENVLTTELAFLKFYKVDNSYSYLLNMKISSLTFERALELEKEAAKLREEVAVLTATTERSMWLIDIDTIQ
jgi:DNA topoisomerase-2